MGSTTSVILSQETAVQQKKEGVRKYIRKTTQRTRGHPHASKHREFHFDASAKATKTSGAERKGRGKKFNISTCDLWLVLIAERDCLKRGRAGLGRGIRCVSGNSEKGKRPKKTALWKVLVTSKWSSWTSFPS